jgi:DNA-binding GntR family transcriptional regulator
LSLPAILSKPLDNALAGDKLRRVTLDEKAYRWVKDALMAGRLPPGQVLTISGLAEQFDISPMPVREALNRLVSEHALTLQPNRSLAVPVMTRDDLAEVTLIRCRLESLAAECATPRLDAGGLAEMVALNRQMERDATLDAAAYLALNRQFHFRLYAAAGLPSLLSLIESQWVRIGPALRLHVDAERRPGPLPSHRALLAALKARDAAAAGAAMIADLKTAAEDILPKLGA